MTPEGSNLGKKTNPCPATDPGGVVCELSPQTINYGASGLQSRILTYLDSLPLFKILIFNILLQMLKYLFRQAIDSWSIFAPVGMGGDITCRCVRTSEL